jgi:hypothetical protein
MSYDPAIGRFLEMDPDTYIDGPNMYQFEKGNPINRVDPTGLWGVTINTSEDWRDVIHQCESESADSLADIESRIQDALDAATDAHDEIGAEPIKQLDNITIVSHGGAGYLAFGSDSGDPWLDIKPVTLENPKSDANKLIVMLSKYLAKNGTVDFAACNAGVGNNGDLLQAALEAAFKANGRSDVHVVLHKKYIHVGWLGPYEADK